MTSRNIITEEMKEPRGRLSQLSAAILRISADLDVDTVLYEVEKPYSRAPPNAPSKPPRRNTPPTSS